MPRISQDQAQERHGFLLELFRSQPEVSRQEALNLYKDKFGATINPKTLDQLREQARNGSAPAAEKAEEPAPEPPEPAEEPESSPRLPSSFSAFSEPMNGAATAPAPKSKPAKGGRQRNIFLEAPPEQLAFLGRVIQQMQEAGATNVRVDHSTDRWMVVVVDAR